MEIIENRCFDQERALYASADVTVRDCRFDGPADGESALKESENVTAERCYFNLRYPLWHVRGLTARDCELTQQCRAAIWYSERIAICGTKLHGIKALRECRDASLSGCDILSSEFGWSTAGLTMKDCAAEGEYFLLRARDITAEGLTLSGKYSFQYIENAVFDRCTFDTKDAFWHARNVTVKNSVIRGEYLAWYSEGLTLERCVITGTQPLCWCRGLRLIDCELRGADLCFEKSDVTAELTAPVISIKNPRSGRILVPAADEIIRDDARARGEVVLTGMPAAPCAGA